MTDQSASVRTYGGWRRSHSMGVGSLDTRQSVALVVAGALPVVLFAFRAYYLAGAALLAALLALPLLLIRRHGVLLLDAVLGWARWSIAHRRGETAYRGGVLAELPTGWDLPGLLAPCTLLDAEVPGRGQRVGIVWNRATGTMAATLLLAPGGALLADRATVDRHVAGWGEVLASLANDSAIRSAQVTIDLAPDPGSQIAEHVAARIAPGAPALAREVVSELAAAAPRLSSRVSTRMTLTLKPADRGRTRAESIAEAAAEVVRALDALPIGTAGAEILRTASATDVCAIVRRAFDPSASDASAEDFNDLLWGESGPVAADEMPGHYEHDGVFSASFVLLEAPRQRVAHSVLLPLLSPGAYPRRVTLAYRTLSPEEAGDVLEREVAAGAVRAEYRRRTHRDATARDRADAERAERAALEEAAGAGLLQFSVLVTVTAPSLEELDDARAEVTKAAGRSRLKLRPARHAQAAVFAAGLPCGVYLPHA